MFRALQFSSRVLAAVRSNRSSTFAITSAPGRSFVTTHLVIVRQCALLRMSFGPTSHHARIHGSQFRLSAGNKVPFTGGGGRRLHSSASHAPSSGHNTVLALVGINLGVAGLWALAKDAPSVSAFMVQHFTTSPAHLQQGYWHTLLTSVFSDFRGGYVAVHMVGLYYFGSSSRCTWAAALRRRSRRSWCRRKSQSMVSSSPTPTAPSTRLCYSRC